MDVVQGAREVMEANWRPAEGYTSPNPSTYPWCWLWDSCFHAVVWAALGEADRAVRELRSVFRWQTDGGFVPHLGYQVDPEASVSFWGRRGASTITQPPMYGHAVAELRRRGVDVPDELVERARAGLQWIVTHRHRIGTDSSRSSPQSHRIDVDSARLPSPVSPNRRRFGEEGARIVIVHPWESGCDDSPEWDPWFAGHDRYQRKGDLVTALNLDREQAATGSELFEVESAGFSALVAFNARELDGADSPIAAAVPVPAEPTGPGLDALLLALDGTRPDLVRTALDDTVFGGRFGPAGVRRDHPCFDPTRYWRGPAWPQLTYLMAVAAERCGLDPGPFAHRLVAGAASSGFAEYWHPDTGEGYGARPQSWTALAAVLTQDP